MANLTPKEIQDLAISEEMVKLYRALLAVQSASLAHVRNGASLADMKQRAKDLTKVLNSVIYNKERVTAPGIAFNESDGTCELGKVWDPVSQTCIPG